MKRMLKFTAAFLSAIIAVQSFTATAFAAEQSKFQTDEPYSRVVDAADTGSSPQRGGESGTPVLPDGEKDPGNSAAQIVAEYPELRTENTKTFLMSDGTFLKAAYDEPVHFRNSAGDWQDIDNTMSTDASKASQSPQVLENKAGAARFRLSTSMKAGGTVSLNTGSYTISWGLDGADPAPSRVVQDQDPESEEKESHNDQFLELKKLHSEVEYRDAFPGVDVQYLISSGSIKENLILKSRDVQKQFTETYQIGDLTAKQKDGKTVELFEQSDLKQEKPVYAISAPQMTDAAGETSDSLSIRILKQEKGTLQIAIEADEAWLADENRAYPVTVDPGVTTPRSPSAIRDTFVSSGDGYHNQAGLSNTMGTMYVGNETANYKTCRMLLNFNLPQFNKGDMIVSAQLNLAQLSDGLSPSNASMQLNAYAMNSPWNETTVTWDNSLSAVNGAIGGPVLDYFIASQSTAATYNAWDITKLVKSWYGGSPNNGIVLKAADESAAARNVYYASNYPGGSVAYPVLSIYYVNNAGLEDYWTCHSQSAGRAGTGSVNDYTGNLAYSVPIMGTTGEKAPMDFSITYNGYRSGTHFEDGQRGLIYGWGWQGNLSQRVDPISESAGTNDAEKAKFKLLASFGYKYVYLDEDGTEHYFKADPNNAAKIIDEDGLGLEITAGGTSDEYYTIKYSDGSRKTFTGSGYLRAIYDSDGNSVTLSYNGALLTGIKDGAGRTASIAHNEYGAIYSVTGPDGTLTKFNYDGGNLSSINFPDQKSVQFFYDANNQLQKAVDVDGARVQYGYYTGSAAAQSRVQSAAEYSSDGTAGNQVKCLYNNDNSTTFEYLKSGQTEAQAQKETYNFDNVGRTTSVVNMDGSASTYTYTDASVKNPKANKLTSQAATSAPVTNILKDHNAELNNGSWVQSNWSSPGGTVSVDASAAYLGTKSLKVTQNQAQPARCGAEQTVTGLVPGYMYTLSAYVKTQGVSGNEGANLYAAAFNGSTQLSTVSGQGLFGDNDWQRISVTFTVPEGATRVLVYGGLSYANGTAWFDCLQLETGNVANLYNLLENSDFRYNTNYLPDHWSVTNFTSGDGMSSGRVRLGGDANLNKNFFQNVYVNRPANSTAFSVSAKSQGKSVPTQRDGRYYAIDVGTYFTDGTSQWNVVDFNPDATGEQYTSGTVAPSEENQSKTISKIEYYIIYYKNANEAFFKNLQLNLDETGTTYVYNDDGTLHTSAQNAKNNGAYKYSDAKELTSAEVTNGASSFKENYTYTYASGNAHRLTAARSEQTGIGLAFGYTSTGNVTDTKMGTVSTSGVLDTNSPYLQSTQGYTNDNYVTSVTDQRGKETKYNVNLTLGLTNAVTDPKGNTVSYTYDPLSHLTTKVSAPGSAGTVENTYGYDGAGRLNRITHNGFDYTFARDGFGNTTGTNAGTRNLITNVFAPGNGNLLSSTYGNGFQIGYGYDSYDRVTSVTKNGAAAYYYTYDARGNLAKVSDAANGVTTDLSYDVGDRLIRKTTSDGGDIRYSYDNMDRTTKTAYTFGGQTKTASAGYGADSRKGNTDLLSGGRITYAYDSLNREAATDINPVVGQDPAFRVQRAYVGVSGNRTTTLVASYGDYKRVNGVNTVLAGYDYTYDDNGNITKVTDTDGKATAYAYDQLNQLVRADDQKAGVSTTYRYDVGGNIAEKKTYAYTTGTLGAETGSVSYAYGDSGWKDLLTNYNGQAITSDEIGNPLSYRDGMEFTWEGRQLKTAAANVKSISYAYNSDGIRTGKTVDGTATSYLLDGSTVIAQKTGDDVLWFLYDSDGTRVGFTYNGAAYYYMTNAQGDVTGIVDSSVNSVVEYSYDAWGRLLSAAGSMADTVGKINTYLYRGYYYDAEHLLVV